MKTTEMSTGVLLARFDDAAMDANVLINDAAIAGGMTFLRSELELLDPVLSVPLGNFTWKRDVPVKTGGGWLKVESRLNEDFGVADGVANEDTAGANVMDIMQANLEKDVWPTHVFKKVLRISVQDVLFAKAANRSLDAILTEGIRRAYEKHQQRNVYLGVGNNTGLLNSDDVVYTTTVRTVSAKTAWADKDVDDILYDVSHAMAYTWEAAGYDEEAIPNQIGLPVDQYNLLLTRKVSSAGNVSALTYLLENNLAKSNGGELKVVPMILAKNRGVGNSQRMVVYCNAPRFLEVRELVGLQRAMTTPDAATSTYNTLYQANVGQLKLFYTATMSYWDGI